MSLVLRLVAEATGLDGLLDGLTEERVRAVVRPIVAETGPEFIRYTVARMGGSAPAAPGSYPAKRTGVLAGALADDLMDGGMRVRIADNASYAGYVNDGTSKMEARPYMEPSLEVIGEQFVAKIQAAIAGL